MELVNVRPTSRHYYYGSHVTSYLDIFGVSHLYFKAVIVGGPSNFPLFQDILIV
jgi:hypothetical protein